MTIKQIEKTKTTVTAPPAKAYTLRGIVLGALARGTSIVHNPLLGEDQLHLIDCLRGLGVTIEQKENELIIHGKGGRFTPIAETINAGESGVSMNFLVSITSLSDNQIIVTGAEGLLARPIGEVAKGVTQLGGEIQFLKKEGFPPFKTSGRKLTGGRAEISGKKTSQYFSSIVTAAPYAEKEVTLVCSDYMTEKPYFDITLEMMEQFGVIVENRNYKEIIIKQGQEYKGREIEVEGDYSSASFFILAAAVCSSEILIQGLRKESKQGDKVFLDLMARMGCKIYWTEEGVTVTGGPLKALEADLSDAPDLVPPLAIAAAFARGESRFTGVGHLRFKECNRLEAMKTELVKMGVQAWYDEDTFTVEGAGGPEKMKGAEIHCYNDHRVAMSFAIAGLVIKNQIITDTKCVAKSFPDFWERLQVFYN